MKNNIDFYRHDVNAHSNAKIKMLRMKYGWAGEGKFWALNGIIGLSDNCEFDISKKFNKAHLCCELDFDINGLDDFIKYLIEDCELLITKGDFITTNDVQEVLEKVMVERKRCKSKRKQGSTKGRPEDDRGQIKNDQGQISQSKVKESKVNKIKENNIYLNESDFETIWKSYPNRTGDKKGCLKKFLNNKYPKDLLPKILEAIKLQVANPLFEGYNMPMCATWINQERWNNEVKDTKRSYGKVLNDFDPFKD